VKDKLNTLMHVSVVLFPDVYRSFNLNSLEILAFNIIGIMLYCFQGSIFLYDIWKLGNILHLSVGKSS